jgi:hypothetical protein
MSIARHHMRMLAESGITSEHAAARGYETVTGPERLAEVNVVRAVRSHVPGLLVPMLRVDGSTWGYQYRPDTPRLRDGKPVKYETPWQQRNGLDIPPGVVEMVADPTIPLWITEGVKKADCGALHGLCIVALSGVWNWLQTNAAGGKMALPEWHDIALNGRRVILGFDGDVARKPAVHRALHALACYLATKGARVEYLHLPDTDDKTGLDDYIVAHGVADLWHLVKPNAPTVSANSGATIVAHYGTTKTGTMRTDKPAPQLVPLDGAGLLDDILDFIRQYVAYPSDHASTAHALWVAHTHLMACWESTPRLFFGSPEPGSGKTRALEVTEPLVPRPVHAVNCTSAYLFRKVDDDAGLPTILYDEIDTVFGPKAKENEDIRGVINAGHRRGAVAGRCVVKGKVIETEELPAYCAVAMAGLDDLPDTIMSRSITIRMRPRAPAETVQPWRHRTDFPIGEKLGRRLRDWADSVREAAAGHMPELPAEVTDRRADIWEPLLTVADLAGGRWPDIARVAAVADVADSKGNRQSLGVLLLRDLKAIFDKHGSKHISSEAVCTDLKGMEESPWYSIRRDGSPIDARGLALRLKQYGIAPRNAKHWSGHVRKSYFRHDFEDAWQRYLTDDTDDTDDDNIAPLSSQESATAATAATNGQRAPNFTPPAGADRCPSCGFHVLTQGHRDTCNTN